ncbi:hypothetical protein NCS56_00775200 [Fusarium sp. Ph1]|nr:hypothetical protein NCS56_00775200 [Fusarium sp. Ph1]
MNTLRRWFGVTAAEPSLPPVSGDKIYPVHMLDDTKSLRPIVVAWTLRFNDVLDADKLHASLSSLLDICDWRKVGGRLRLKSNGELEIHAPQPFTSQRPAISFSHKSLSVSIEEHPVAKNLPKATKTPSIHPGPPVFREFAARDDAPQTLEQFVSGDVPMLSLHITSFSDATLVGLSWPHVLMDVMGQQALLRGWTLVLAGRESHVPPMLGASDDPICAATDSSQGNPEDFKMAHKQLRGWGMAMFGLRFAWDMLWSPTVEAKTIFLPKKAVAELRRRAREDLDVQDGGEKPFVSEGDVLTAWAAQLVASSLPQPRPLTLLHAINTRFRLPSVAQSSGVFVQNMALAAFTFLSPEVAAGPLGLIALENRRHLMEQATEGQVLAFIRHLRQQSQSGSDPAMVCGESDALLMPFTNWTKAGLFEAVDFGPAVLREGETGGSRTNPPGTMVYHHSQAMHTSPSTRNVVAILGKDREENYWITAFLLPPAWAKIEEGIGNMNMV